MALEMEWVLKSKRGFTTMALETELVLKTKTGSLFTRIIDPPLSSNEYHWGEIYVTLGGKELRLGTECYEKTAARLYRWLMHEDTSKPFQVTCLSDPHVLFFGRREGDYRILEFRDATRDENVDNLIADLRLDEEEITDWTRTLVSLKIDLTNTGFADDKDCWLPTLAG